MIAAELLKQRTLETVLKRYDRKIMKNTHRAEYVECLVANLLGNAWTLPWTEGRNWASWYLRHGSGTTLEIKQAAARQPWHREANFRPRPPSFDIAPRKGHWTTESEWIDEPGRAAALYVFAWHPETDAKLADHRDPQQWSFYVMQTKDLPAQQNSIGLAGIEALTPVVQADGLAPAVRRLLEG